MTRRKTLRANLQFGGCLLCLLWVGSAAAQLYPIRNMQLLAQVPPWEMELAVGGGNDIWGWTDPDNGREYALVGRQQSTAFLDVTVPSAPVYLGELPSHTGSSVWRDIKVYDNHAYVVSDSNGPHGVQIFDLRNLRGVTTPQIFSETANYSGGNLRSAHNIAINEDTGFAYVVGSNLAAGGLVMLNLSNPTSIFEAGRFSADGYTHDTQVVLYQGLDTAYVGREIAFSSNVDTLTIVDVTNKANPTMLARQGYPDSRYAHQGWLSEDHRYFFLGDELDEQFFQNTRTHVWDVSDLDAPEYVGFHQHETRSTDHNLYVHNGLIYEANYSVGLRVLEMTDPSTATLTEIAYLDTFPFADVVGYNGAWSVYPFFDSGTIIVNDRIRGLFVARLAIVEADIIADGQLDCSDVNALTAAIASGNTDALYDLNRDGTVNLADLDAWLHEAGEVNLGLRQSYLLGDADLDGVVDGNDLITWNSHKFTASSAWCSGDFNADGIIDANDFILWNLNKFSTSSGSASNPLFSTSPSMQAVPEPHVGMALGLALFMMKLVTARAQRKSPPSSPSSPQWPAA